MRLQLRDTRAATPLWDQIGAALPQAREVGTNVRGLGTHRPSCAATHPGLLWGSARSASSVWVDGCKAHHRRSQRTCSHHQHGGIFVRSNISAHR